MEEGMGSAAAAAVATAAAAINPFTESFASVLGISPELTAELIERMANDNYRDKSVYFIYIAQQLPVLDLNLKENVIPIASGSYGQISRIRNEKRPKRVIKEQKVDFDIDLNIKYGKEYRQELKEINLFLRDIFIEAFIQFILGNDNKYGNNIVKIYKLYRSSDFDSIFIEMERIDGDMLSYAKFNCAQLKVIDTHFLVSVLMNTSYMLMNLHSRYNFVHRDLKINNIGLKVDGSAYKVMLFDFGASCIDYEGKKYSAKSFTEKVGTPCNISGDLALLCYSIYLQLYQCLDISVIGFLEAMFVHDGLMRELENIRVRKGMEHKIHSVYNFNGTLFKDKYAHLNPNNFIASLSAFIVRNGLRPVILDPVPNENSRSLTYSVSNNNMEGGRTRRHRRRSHYTRRRRRA